jgi:2-keto-3-deoxy-6-phosphogluconate aldolase
MLFTKTFWLGATMYTRDSKEVEKALRKRGIIVIMLKAHARAPEDIITTVTAIHEAGLFPEVTYRIDEGIIQEAMTELNRMRDSFGSDGPLRVGIGSITVPAEMEKAIELGFDMVVSPDNAFEGFGKKIEFARMAQKASVYSAPGAMTPGEFRYWLVGEDGITPDAIKVFPASVYGPEGLGRMLDPYQRDRHQGRIVIPTGGVNASNGPAFQKNIRSRGFDVALAMSDPMSLVLQEGKPGHRETIEKSLRQFKEQFRG